MYKWEHTWELRKEHSACMPHQKIIAFKTSIGCMGKRRLSRFVAQKQMCGKCSFACTKCSLLSAGLSAASAASPLSARIREKEITVFWHVPHQFVSLKQIRFVGACMWNVSILSSHVLIQPNKIMVSRDTNLCGTSQKTVEAADAAEKPSDIREHFVHAKEHFPHIFLSHKTR